VNGPRYDETFTRGGRPVPVDDELNVEQWSVIEQITPEDTWVKSGMF